MDNPKIKKSIVLLPILLFSFILFPQNSVFCLTEEENYDSIYYEFGFGYAPWVNQSNKIQDLMKNYEWESTKQNWVGIFGLYSPIINKKWLLGVDFYFLMSQHAQKYNSDETLSVFNAVAHLTSRYFLVGSINDGLYLSDKLGLSLTQVTRSDQSSTGWVLGLALGAETGYATKLNSNTSISLNFGFYWNGIGASTQDNYLLDSMTFAIWTGLIF